MKKLMCIIISLIQLMLGLGGGEMPGENAEYVTVQNPVCANGADPWVVEHDGRYFYCFATGNGVGVAEIPSIDKISSAGFSQVYTAPAGTAYSHNYWASELHYINGEWYIYVAADDGDNFNHRMYVLKGTSQNPTDQFVMVGKISDSTDKWAIDGTVAVIGGELYFVWSGWEGDENVAQNIYIAHMSNPWTVDSERTLISSPCFLWERKGEPYVNEGPAVLYHGEDIFIAYSASGSWTDDYCLGLLTFKGGDPLEKSSWKKSMTPVFRKNSETAYGPGHCSFTTAVDGSTWMIYHANLESGTGWGGRSIWIAPVSFTSCGTPVFGKPEKQVQFPIAMK